MFLDELRPGGDEFLSSILVFTPGALGLVVLLFAALPKLVRAVSFRVNVLGPAHLLIDVLDASPLPAPDDIVPQ